MADKLGLLQSMYNILTKIIKKVSKVEKNFFKLSNKYIKGEDNCPVNPKTIIESTITTKENLKVKNASICTHDPKTFREVKEASKNVNFKIQSTIEN